MNKFVKRVNIGINCLAVIFLIATLAVPLLFYLETSGKMGKGSTLNYLEVYAGITLPFLWGGIAVIVFVLAPILAGTIAVRKFKTREVK